MNSDALADLALASFDRMVAATPGFRSRPGQREMARRIAEALSSVPLGEQPDPGRTISVIQAGTGVGKSAAYLSTTVALALALKTRVVISTATVALQEQLMSKDLPALAAVLETPFVHALAKGRGRYVCKFKLERLAGPDADELTEELFGIDEDLLPARSAFTGQLAGEDSERRRGKLYAALAMGLANGQWDGDRDQLAEQPDPRDWSAVAAERHTCTARHCPRYQQCSYYNARSQLAQAQVIVVNHDLLLASLGMKALPELDNCLLVFDEGHHLPAVALAQFASRMDLSGLRWLDKLPKTLRDVSASMGVEPAQDVDTLAQQLKAALQDVARLVVDLLKVSSTGYDGVYRFKNGLLPDFLLEPMGLIQGHAAGLSKVLEALGAELKKRIKEDPSQAVPCSLLYARLGQLAPKLASALQTSSLLLEQGAQPLAKWLQSDSASGLLYVSAHACAIEPGDLLRQTLWSRVRGAVITSATLTSCGSFDFFLQESGLSDNPDVSTLEVESPFDYRSQGRLTVVETEADPKNVAAYTREMVAELLSDLSQLAHGALVLFTSRAQMKVALDALSGALQERVLVQGQMARARLLATHQARVEAGLASAIFGLQSFGEGLDLPGQLCETVLIAKLPFSPPSDPVAEARSEWLMSLGRDPFSELVVPATGIKLLQWSGRAIRTENDQANVICYDRRLLRTAFGRRMLQGLPPYPLSRRVAGVALTL
ncbi:MAG: ATP-dependent DNA helicase DinG [Rhodoferax sp.]|uniref:ATP-dependent DNA helicase DinG n=1 Tax=Rhodoferax sp. TaxID=50421 RepID=UPI00260C1781|nr:ATP-dependent DNA helicase DinG [Rhodoferax sp.]MDD5336524.1 ATP-dependent DNA helicase DinG [Rhodoferax sp.]